MMTMQPEASHIACYNRGTPEGMLPGRDNRKHNIQLYKKQGGERFEELQKSGCLLNIIIHSRDDIFRMAFISGDAAAIEQLKKYLEEKDWGTVTPDFDIALIE